MRINIQKLSTGQKLRTQLDTIATVEAVYYQGGQWKADFSFGDGSVWTGAPNNGIHSEWELA